MARFNDNWRQVLKHRRPTTGLFQRIAFSRVKTLKAVHVRDGSGRWNAVITLHQKRSKTMPRVHMRTEIEQCRNSSTFPKELCHSFSSVTGAKILWWIGHVPWQGLWPKRRNVASREWLWKSCWGDMERRLARSILLFFCHLSGATCQNSNPCFFTCDKNSITAHSVHLNFDLTNARAD